MARSAVSDAEQLLQQYADANNFKAWCSLARKNRSKKLLMLTDPIITQSDHPAFLAIAVKAFNTTCAVVFTDSSSLLTTQPFIVMTAERIAVIARGLLRKYLTAQCVSVEEKRQFTLSEVIGIGECL